MTYIGEATNVKSDKQHKQTTREGQTIIGKTIIAINNRGFYVGTEASNAKATNTGFWKQQI